MISPCVKRWYLANQVFPTHQYLKHLPSKGRWMQCPLWRSRTKRRVERHPEGPSWITEEVRASQSSCVKDRTNKINSALASASQSQAHYKDHSVDVHKYYFLDEDQDYYQYNDHTNDHDCLTNVLSQSNAAPEEPDHAFPEYIRGSYYKLNPMPKMIIGRKSWMKCSWNTWIFPIPPLIGETPCCGM